MAENEGRRQARRQSRGLLRADAIVRAAELLFAELGYDKTTTNMIAERAGVSPGSLYQFFPNKEAIAHAYAAEAVIRLHQVYDGLLAPSTIDLPLAAFIDLFIDVLIAFNRANPGYFALSLASTLSEPLAQVLQEFQAGVQVRLSTLLAARWPQGSATQQQLAGLVAYRIFIAMLPLTLRQDEQSAMLVGELKAVIYRYLAPLIDTAAIGASERTRSGGD